MGYYDDMSKGYDRLHKQEQLAKLKIIAAELKPKKHETLLDVGCGTAFAREIFKCNYVGIDPAFSMLQGRKKLVNALGEKLPFRSNAFDYAISVTALHNFTNARKGLLEIRRVGKNEFAFSVLKKSKHYEMIEKEIMKLFKIMKKIDEEKDTIYICESS